jgi:hypothetical protein
MRPVRWSRGAFGLRPQSPGTFISGRFLIRFGPMDLQRGSALKRGAKSLWCQETVVCRCGEQWSNAGWLP